MSKKTYFIITSLFIAGMFVLSAKATLASADKIYVIGDSMAVGLNAEFTNLMSADSSWQVIDWAVGGTCTDVIAGQLQGVITAGDAKYVIIWAGTNDELKYSNTEVGSEWHCAYTGSSKINASDIEQNLQAMYDAAHNAGIKVVTIGLSPVKNNIYGYPWTPEMQGIQDTVNAWLPSAKNVDFFIPVYSQLADPQVQYQLNTVYSWFNPDSNKLDYLHLNDAGNTIVANLLKNNVSWKHSDNNPNIATECAKNTCVGNSCYNGTAWIPGTKTTDCASGSAQANPASIKPATIDNQPTTGEISYLTWTSQNAKSMEAACLSGPTIIPRGGWYLNTDAWSSSQTTYKKPSATTPDGYPMWFHPNASGTEICTFYPINISDGLPGTPFSTKVEVNATGGGTCESKVNLGITILVLDDISVEDKVEDDFKKALNFVEANSKFKLSYKIVQSNLPHSYTKYDCPEGKQACVVVNKEDINQDVIKNLPTSTFYFIFWKANGTPVLQAGSTWGVAYGIMKDGIQRPYSTVSVDQWWYNRDPYEGFEYRSTQLISHEVINLIQGLIETDPYNCASLTADNTGYAYTDESSRLKKMTDECYQKIAAKNGGDNFCADGLEKKCANFPDPNFCPGGLNDVIISGTDATGCSTYSCKSRQNLGNACQPDDPSCAQHTCKDVSCFDGCNLRVGLKDCKGRR